MRSSRSPIRDRAEGDTRQITSTESPADDRNQTAFGQREKGRASGGRVFLNPLKKIDLELKSG
jgi:hypothetical protein